jgi:hypothetical protein
MLPGLDRDDRYRMVEDEFLATAQRFTAHLHRAEYDRLKRVAKSQNAATIRAIERPVVAGLRKTNTAKRRQEAVRKVASQRKVLGDDRGAADDLPWMGTSLQGLMDAPRIESRAIAASSGPASSGTRAAAGFTSTRGEATELERPGVPPSPARPRTSDVKPQSAVRHYLGSSHSATDAPIDMDDDDDDDENDPFGINKRRVRREISREQLRKTSEMSPPRKPSPDSIPSFLQ